MSEYQFYHNDEYEFLWKLLADPVNNTHLYTYNLQRLVNDNPQSGIFRALLARTGGEENFKLASVHFNSRSLYKLINYPSGFEKVTRDKVIIDPGIPSKPLEVRRVNEIPNNLISEPRAYTVDENNDSHKISEEKTAGIMEVSMAAEYDLTSSYSITDPGVFGADVSIAQLKEDLKNLKAGVSKPNVANNGIVPVSKNNKPARYQEVMPYSFTWWLNKTRKEAAENFQPYAKTTPVINYKQADQKKDIDELQHQYVENIFHLTSVEELDKSTADKPVTWDFNRKESKIIERFLEKEPQIRPQQGEKLDGENKAKKSSEDSDEIVTETLAAIYAEQMLFQKSITAYKKLMLRFPEKRLYFADKIEQLEKKTNL